MIHSCEPPGVLDCLWTAGRQALQTQVVQYLTSARSKQAAGGVFRRAWSGGGGTGGSGGTGGGGAYKLWCGENVWGGVNNKYIISTTNGQSPSEGTNAEQLFIVLLVQSDWVTLALLAARYARIAIPPAGTWSRQWWRMDGFRGGAKRGGGARQDGWGGGGGMGTVPVPPVGRGEGKSVHRRGEVPGAALEVSKLAAVQEQLAAAVYFFLWAGERVNLVRGGFTFIFTCLRVRSMTHMPMGICTGVRTNISSRYTHYIVAERKALPQKYGLGIPHT